jgi:uncharacterized OsmC-like protein
MDADTLRALQAPLKSRYREDPASARTPVRAVGRIDPTHPACAVETTAGIVVAGLHPATGGDGSEACSGDMLLQALVACAGVTLASVATVMGIALKGGEVRADGMFDARGTLGVDRTVPVGLTEVRLTFAIDTDTPPDQVRRLVELTERYCVILQTLRSPPAITAAIAARPAAPAATT